MRKDGIRKAKTAAIAGKRRLSGNRSVIAALALRFTDGQPHFIIAKHRAVGSGVYDIAAIDRPLRREILLRGKIVQQPERLAAKEVHTRRFDHGVQAVPRRDKHRARQIREPQLLGKRRGHRHVPVHAVVRLAHGGQRERKRERAAAPGVRCAARLFKADVPVAAVGYMPARRALEIHHPPAADAEPVELRGQTVKIELRKPERALLFLDVGAFFLQQRAEPRRDRAGEHLLGFLQGEALRLIKTAPDKIEHIVIRIQPLALRAALRHNDADAVVVPDGLRRETGQHRNVVHRVLRIGHVIKPGTHNDPFFRETDKLLRGGFCFGCGILQNDAREHEHDADNAEHAERLAEHEYAHERFHHGLAARQNGHRAALAAMQRQREEPVGQKARRERHGDAHKEDLPAGEEHRKRAGKPFTEEQQIHNDAEQSGKRADPEVDSLAGIAAAKESARENIDERERDRGSQPADETGQRHRAAEAGHARAPGDAENDRQHRAAGNAVLEHKVRHNGDKHRREIHEDARRGDGHHVDRVIIAEREHALPENADGSEEPEVLLVHFELADIAESGAEEAERGHGAADGKNAHRAQSRAGQCAGKETGQPEKCAGQHGGDRVAIHKVSSLSLFYNNRIWHAAAIRQSKNPAKIFAGFLAF